MADLTITRARTAVFDIAVTSEGVAVDLSGKSLRFAAKSLIGSTDLMFSKATGAGITTNSPASAGLATLQIDPADTSGLPDIQRTSAVWDLTLVDSTNVYQLDSGNLSILGNVVPYP